jgi:hypothetical protein
VPRSFRAFCRTTPIILLLAVTGCIWLFRSPSATELTANTDSTIRVRTPVKLHLTDGSTIVFPLGVAVSRDSVRGAGMRYGLTLADSAPVSSVARSRIAAMSRFHNRYDGAASFVASVLATGLGLVAGGLALLIAACSGGGCD